MKRKTTTLLTRSFGLAVALAAMSINVPNASAQQWDGPPRDGGYANEYREQPDVTQYAQHRGFEDGMMEGERDRETGHSFRPTHSEAYEDAPGHDHLPIRRQDYKNLYREGYVRGYERGYGR